MKRQAGRLRPYAPALVFGGLFCVLLALHAAMPVELGDDLMYRDMLHHMVCQKPCRGGAVHGGGPAARCMACGRCTAGGAVCISGRANGRGRAKRVRCGRGGTVFSVL